MSIRTSFLFLLLGATAWAQTQRIDPRSAMHITFPEDSPVTVVSADWGESNASARGGAMLLDLHTSLSLRNSSSRRIRAITLFVSAQDVTPGGKASVSVASLNAGPGENFPIRIDLRLLRPLQAGGGPLVVIDLDGILFDDLSFYGPNKLNSRRSMTVWEMEARRDRQYFRQVLESRGREGLKSEMLASLEHQSDRSGMDARVAQAGKATTTRNERQIQVAFLESPSSPVAASDGMVRIADNEARSPRLFVRNTTSRPVRAIEMGWLVKDDRGREYVAGSIPVDLPLAARQRTTLVQDVTYKFSQPNGEPIGITDMTGFLSSVEFGDGSMWVPERNGKLPIPSPEEQRLTALYRKRGLEALVDELKRF
jgi:hypothetical protein